MISLLCVAIMLFTSELIIWVLSRALHRMGLEFFASILGMVLIFCITTTASCFLRQGTDGIYHDWIKPKVDFINTHIGLGFSVPIIMLNQAQTLGSREIARIIGAFAITNGVVWVSLFVFSCGILHGPSRLVSKRFEEAMPSQRPCRLPFGAAQHPFIVDSNRSPLSARSDGLPSCSNDSSQQTLYEDREPSRESTSDVPTVWRFLRANYAIMLFLSGIFAIGVPISIYSHDERMIDGFSMCLIWISSIKAQRSLKTSCFTANGSWPKKALAIILNPVLITVLVMVAYTRVRAIARGQDGLACVLESFSSGTPLHSLWTAAVSGTELTKNPNGWFGAGDAALLILECGVLIWGFKLFEYRHQIFRIAGLITILVCTAAAAGNVFLSVLIARAMGLRTSEILSFAARSITMALAKPAMEAVEGNIAVNATLVVGNGVLGQLMYPLISGRLGVAGETEGYRPSDETSTGSASPPKEDSTWQWISAIRNAHGDGDEESDGPLTIATGIAIGVNGAAMGVSYLYEAQSRAAPYAALSMTVFGIMTVVFTTVEPFKSVLIRLSIH